jgi:hypothetical protein
MRLECDAACTSSLAQTHSPSFGSGGGWRVATLGMYAITRNAGTNVVTTNSVRCSISSGILGFECTTECGRCSRERHTVHFLRRDVTVAVATQLVSRVDVRDRVEM